MILSSDRVPGQLLPVCSPWHGNTGRTLAPATASLSGPDGIGKIDWLSFSPVVQAYRRAKEEKSAVHGLGQADVTGVIVGGVVLYALVYGTLGYFAGKAMAPSHTQQRGYAVAGALLAIFGGVVGLGAEGIYASTKK